jgi:hypothetical protein
MNNIFAREGTAVVVTALLSFCTVVGAQEAQVLNPLFVEARELWHQLSASTLPPDVKAPYGKRFGELAQQQGVLWRLAGQADSGQCTGQCLSSYNGQIEVWEGRLQAFNHDARQALESSNLPRVGVWKTYGKWTHVNVACLQTYICVPSETMIAPSDTRIVSTPARTVTGVCQADRSDPESCGTCTAEFTPPDERCEWRLERR